jgi:Nucleotidyltransferase of unknown function (DUF6036)
MQTELIASAHNVPPEPWRSFLRDLDAQLHGVVALRCIGGFVVTQQYGIGRSTSDIDFLSVSAVSDDNVEALGGLGSELHKKYRVYLQYVGIATPPCGYADRLQVMFPEAHLKKLQLFALDPVDLALSKLERNSDRDREDVLRLARAGYIEIEVLRTRYFDEVRPYLLNKHEWHDQTLELWIEMISASADAK